MDKLISEVIRASLIKILKENYLDKHCDNDIKSVKVGISINDGFGVRYTDLILGNNIGIDPLS